MWPSSLPFWCYHPVWTIPSSLFAADTAPSYHHHSLAAVSPLCEQYHHRSLLLILLRMTIITLLLLLPPCVNNTIIVLCCWYLPVWPSSLPCCFYHPVWTIPSSLLAAVTALCEQYHNRSLSFFVIFITMSGSLQTSCCFNKHSTNLQMYIVWGSVFSILSDNWVHIIVWIVLNVVFGYKKHNLTLGTDNVNNLWSTIDDRWLLLTHTVANNQDGWHIVGGSVSTKNETFLRICEKLFCHE